MDNYSPSWTFTITLGAGDTGRELKQSMTDAAEKADISLAKWVRDAIIKKLGAENGTETTES